MAGNQNPDHGLADDFFEQILAVQPGGYSGGSDVVGSTSLPLMGLQLGSGGGGGGGIGGNNNMGMMPLGLNLEHHGFLRQQEDGVGVGHVGVDNTSNNGSSSSTSGINDRDSMHMPTLFPVFGQLHSPTLRPPQQPPPQPHQTFNSPPTAGAVSGGLHPPAIRPRVRARRGQATDPHSIAERLRRERIAERMKALQELVPTANKTDRAAMLDEIVDYVKFLRLQVKVLSMSRLGAAGAVAQLVADVPASVEGEGIEGGGSQQPWEKWSTDGTEQQVAKLMEEDIGAAMQFLQSKALCIMPISLASAIFRTQPQDSSTIIKPETSTS